MTKQTLDEIREEYMQYWKDLLDPNDSWADEELRKSTWAWIEERLGEVGEAKLPIGATLAGIANCSHPRWIYSTNWVGYEWRSCSACGRRQKEEYFKNMNKYVWVDVN